MCWENFSKEIFREVKYYSYHHLAYHEVTTDFSIIPVAKIAYIFICGVVRTPYINMQRQVTFLWFMNDKTANSQTEDNIHHPILFASAVHFTRMTFDSQFKSHRIHVMLWFNSWSSDCFKFMHMPWHVLSWHVQNFVTSTLLQSGLKQNNTPHWIWILHEKSQVGWVRA